MIVGDNLRWLRKRERYSLDTLAQLSGVSRAMLGQIECGKSAPIINLLGRIAVASVHKGCFSGAPSRSLDRIRTRFTRAAGEYGSVIFIAGNIPFVSEITLLIIITKLEQFDYQGATAVATVMLVVSFTLLLERVSKSGNRFCVKTREKTKS